jgi:hypothetical protein
VADIGMFYGVDENNKERFFPVSAFGSFVYKQFPEETMKSRYKVRYGIDGKQVYPPLK